MCEDNVDPETTETETTETTSTTSSKTSVWKKIITVVWQAIVAAITAWTASSCCNTLID